MNRASWTNLTGFGAVLLFSTATSLAEGIPEPSGVLYGEVRNAHGSQGVRLTSGSLTWIFQPLPSGAPVVMVTQLTNLYDQFSFILPLPSETVLGTLRPSPGVLVITNPPITYQRSSVMLDGQPIFLKYPLQSTFSMAGTNRGSVERVDLTLSREDQDSDGDGLPDWWETLHFAGTTNANTNADSDGDGVNNLTEYRAGTDPRDPKSVFEFINILPHPSGGILVEWASVGGNTYILQRSGNLLRGFVDIATDIAATAPVNSYHDWTAFGAGPYFFRLQIQEGRPSLADADGNGLADEWERRLFGRIRIPPNADGDRDGSSNLAEFGAGTNPTDSDSVFKLLKITPFKSLVQLEWSSIVNKSYRLLRSTDPQTGYEVIDTVTATPPVNYYWDSPPGTGPSFYRIQIAE